jgi:hypothetical protein
VGFVPVTGPASFRLAEPPRESVVVFTDGDARRTVELPMRSALPVLAKARVDEAAHPSVGLIGGAVVFGMRLVADGRFEPSPDGPWWQPVELDTDETDRLERLARARAWEELDVAAAEGLARRVIAAVVDAMPRSAPSGSAASLVAGADAGGSTGPGLRPGGARRTTARGGDPAAFQARLADRLARIRADGGPVPDGRPHLVTLSLRLEAAEEELVAGSVRLVLQVHDERNPLHLCDAALLWTDPETSGFGSRALTHTTVALRAAADAWPVLDRLQALRVPDEITLDTDELVSLLESGVGALREIGVDVLWPRSLGRDLVASTVLEQRPRERRAGAGGDGSQREEALQDRHVRPGGALRLQLADLARRRAAHRRGDGPARRVSRAGDPAARSVDRRRSVDRAQGQEAVGADRHRPPGALAAALSGVVQVEDRRGAGPSSAPILRRSASSCARRRPVADRGADRPRGDAARLPAPRPDLAGRADLPRARRLPGRRHGPGQDAHPDRPAPAPRRFRQARPAALAGPTLVVCPTSLLGNWEAEIRRFAPGVPTCAASTAGATSTGSSGGWRGFVLTTYGTLRNAAPTSAKVAVGPGRRRRGAAREEPRDLDRAGAAHDPVARRGWR